jgi:hypothetical protein
MKSPARRFTLVMLSMSAIFVGAPVLLNWLVDPYDRFGNNRLGVYIMAEREMKSAEIGRHPHDALLIGNSRIAEIPASRLEGFRFFNAAFAAANSEEIYWFLRRHAHGQQLVVLGIDLGAKDPPVLQGDIFRRGDWASAAENLVNLQTAEYSFKTLFSHWAGKPSHYQPNGELAEPDRAEVMKRNDPALGSAIMARYKSAMTLGHLRPPYPLTFCRKIADMLRERKIPCVVVMPPVHEEAVRYIRAMHMQGEWDAWRKDIGDIFPDIVDLTDSPYGAAAGFPPSDPVHFKPDVAVKFMNGEVVPFAMKAVRKYGR